MGLPAADASGASDGRWRDTRWVLKERPVDASMARTLGVREPGVGDNSGQLASCSARFLRLRRAETAFPAVASAGRSQERSPASGRRFLQAPCSGDSPADCGAFSQRGVRSERQGAAPSCCDSSSRRGQ
ncbi:unnamed protein product [Rangifer tarandus platyrhynchus]|uniref:Uncharacterized protein n=3 Tax=Rangifer tarandus platyrhynchus TaxID=3082113 RepID=A0ACB0F4L5_RANTA|nr:unnamed protein product [Rangifer tarandus platyrhynchus]CAI9707935.1 unnamed protein product [Rangifer tarandus platyrhynchus]